MSRKGQARIREITPDPKYHDRTVAKFVNIVMERGKKSTTEQILYGAIDLVGERTKEAGAGSFQEGAGEHPARGRGSLAARRRRQLPGPGGSSAASAQLSRDAMAGDGGASARGKIDGRATWRRDHGSGAKSRRCGQKARRHASHGRRQPGIRALPLVTI